MGRTWLIGIAILSGSVCGRALAADAPEKFAADELHRYLIQMHADRKVDVSIDLSLSPDEKFKVHSGDEIKIVASNGFSAVRAVYDYLDKQGCRFLSPTFDFYQGASEVTPTNHALNALAMMSKTPRLKLRKLYVEEGHSHTPENLAQIVDWMPKVGFNTLVVPANYQGAGRVMWDNFRTRVTPECQKRDITIEVGGHGYQNFLNAEMEDGKLYDQHPEWFGADASGKRHKEHNRVFCTSNKEAVDYLIKNFIAYVKDRPEIQIYDFWPPDGAKWCECDNCKELGGAADREAILVSEVQKRVHEVRPDLRLEFIAYQLAITPPEHAKVDKSILIDFCPINQQFDHQINDPAAAKNKAYADALLAWRKAFDGDISIYSYYRKYAWDSLPVIIPHYMQKDLQWYASVPVQGISSYSEPADWATYELNHYVLAALAWDVNADVDAIIKKFCAARYGDFAEQAASTLAALEEITRNTSSIPNTSLKSAEQIEADLGRATKLADGAASDATKATDPAVNRALERLNLACMYLVKDLEIQKLRASGAAKDEVTAKSQDLHQWLAGHANDGVFLVKDQRISTTRMLRRYSGGTGASPVQHP